MITVIMPVYLGAYQGAATNREIKFIRAVKSFLNQTYNNKRLIIVADGCKRTSEIYGSKWQGNPKVSLLTLEKQPLFSGYVRQCGLQNVGTDGVVAYLDSDDYFEQDHLEMIMSQFKYDNNFVYWNDKINDGNKIFVRDTKFEFGKIGTSCFAHLANYPIKWKDGYGHDFKTIMEMKNDTIMYKKIAGCGYVVCHLPNTLDV